MKNIILISSVVCFIFTPLQAYAMEKGVFQPPSLEGYKLEKEFDVDVDEDGIKESNMTRYQNSAGDRILKLKTKNRIWGWAVKRHKYPEDKNDLTKNYAIKDSNCNGIFDEIYRWDEQFYLPDCLKDKGKQ